MLKRDCAPVTANGVNTYPCRVVTKDRVSGFAVGVEFLDPCKTCGVKHRHGFGNGPRAPHCGTSPLPVVGPTGPRQDIYFLDVPTGAELAKQLEKARKVEADYTRVPGFAEKQLERLKCSNEEWRRAFYRVPARTLN